MKIFEKPNLAGGWKCPICKKNDEKSVFLVPIDGTRKGNVEEAQQIHVSCLQVRFSKLDSVGHDLIYQMVPREIKQEERIDE